MMEYLVCNICKLPFKSPRKLPCGHSFCSDCLQWTLRKGSLKVQNDGTFCFFCKTCGQLCETNIKHGVKEFKRQTFYDSLMAVLLFKASFICSHCSKISDSKSKWLKSKISDGTECCLSCQMFLCERCVGIHKKNNGAQEHEIFKIANLRKEVFLLSHKNDNLQKQTIILQFVTIKNVSTLCYSLQTTFAPKFITADIKNDKVILINEGGLAKIFSFDGHIRNEIDFKKSLRIFREHQNNKLCCHNFEPTSYSITSDGDVISTIVKKCSHAANHTRKSADFIAVAIVQSIQDGSLQIVCSIPIEKKTKKSSILPCRRKLENKIHPQEHKSGPSSVVCLFNGVIIVADSLRRKLYVFNKKFEFLRCYDCLECFENDYEMNQGSFVLTEIVKSFMNSKVLLLDSCLDYMKPPSSLPSSSSSSVTKADVVLSLKEGCTSTPQRKELAPIPRSLLVSALCSDGDGNVYVGMSDRPGQIRVFNVNAGVQVASMENTRLLSCDNSSYVAMTSSGDYLLLLLNYNNKMAADDDVDEDGGGGGDSSVASPTWAVHVFKCSSADGRGDRKKYP
ncbi:hypothetical protein HELRODRAFT_188469, partial [Helobdella robusta]|uniref:RING-type domain-containing protein n=1 Tax=Helobdella robusta TaxID=6412 RepID=T1FQ10_HELRO